MSCHLTLPGLSSAISSRGSAYGATPYVAPDGRMIAPSGQGHAPANLSARQAKDRGLLMSGIYGPRSTISSASAALQSSLASRLQAKTALLGSTLFKLTWKERVTPAGRSIPALRASVRRISDNECIGWQTPRATEGMGRYGKTNGKRYPKLWGEAELSSWPTPKAAQSGPDFAIQSRVGSGGLSLPTVAQLAGWPTPRVGRNWGNGRPDRPRGPNGRLEDVVPLAGWTTPSARDWKDTPGMATERPDGRKRLDQLPRQAALAGWKAPAATDDKRGGSITTGMTGGSLAQQVRFSGPARLTVTGKLLTGFFAEMESGGQLNPAHARWLMGLPIAWDDCAAMVMPLSRRRQRRS